MKHVTIKDIARELNFSISTISRAFNDKYDIRPETRELILRKAEEMGYRPNPIAKKLIQQRSFNIGMVVPEFLTSYFPQVIIGTQEVLIEKGYQVLVMQSNESWETELTNVEALEGNMVDGLIISLCSEAQNLKYYEKLIDNRMPMVFFNRVADSLNASKVLFDDFKWAFFATEHLLVQGFRNIVHLSCPRSLTFTKNRIRGFEAAHRKYKVPSGKIIPCDFRVDEGERVAREMIERDEIPDAIFAASDQSAVGAMKVLKQEGFRIPDDVAIVGFSESRLAPHVDPPLTSVVQPTRDIGRAAAELLLSQINSPDVYIPQKIVLNGRLNIRESSMKVKP